MEKITVETLVNASPEKVWECFTEPAHITGWAFASDDWEAPHAENDVKPGGVFKTRMQARDGSAGFDFAGTYDEVVPHKRIAYTMDDRRKVINVFTAEGEGTRVTVSFDPENENPPDVQRQGWQAILDNFKTYAEALK